MRARQAALIPFVCGWVDCEEDAVCGLTNGVVTVNVCRAHFLRMKERDYVEGEERFAEASEQGINPDTTAVAQEPEHET